MVGRGACAAAGVTGADGGAVNSGVVGAAGAGFGAGLGPGVGREPCGAGVTGVTGALGAAGAAGRSATAGLGAGGPRGSRTGRLRRGGRAGLGSRLAGGAGLGAAPALEGVCQLAYYGRLDRRGCRSDEFTEFLELGHDGLALNPELLGEFVYPDLSHFAPFRSGLRPDRRYFMGVLIACSSSAHRNLDLLPTRGGYQSRTVVPCDASYGVACSTYRRNAAVSSAPGARSALTNARRRTARSRQTRAGCTYAPRPGSVPR